MNIKMLKAALAGLVLSVSAFANAGLIVSIDYEVNQGNWGSGHFEGMDNNLDGFLTFNEITFFDGSNNIENQTVNLATLFDVGDFDINAGTWLSNAVSWNGQPDNSWFTWNNRANSVNTTWAVVTTTHTTNEVPEPSTLAILALGLMGLASRRSLLANQK